jgi:hypothetical protein
MHDASGLPGRVRVVNRRLSLEAAQALQRTAGRYSFGLPDLSDPGGGDRVDVDAPSAGERV